MLFGDTFPFVSLRFVFVFVNFITKFEPNEKLIKITGELHNIMQIDEIISISAAANDRMWTFSHSLPMWASLSIKKYNEVP